MDLFQRPTFIFVLLATVAFASIIPAQSPQVEVRQVPAPAPAAPDLAVQQLVAGISYNIMSQKGEIAVVSVMQSLSTMPAADPTLFKAAKDDLMSFMSAGMRIRQNNLQLSKVNPQVTRGLTQLEQTQVLQLALANQLNGTATDGPLLQKLQGQVEAAIQKNQGLQSIAQGGSGVPMITKTP